MGRNDGKCLGKLSSESFNFLTGVELVTTKIEGVRVGRQRKTNEIISIRGEAMD